MKTCFRCGQIKPIEEFYRHSATADGHLGKCRSCTCEDVKQNERKRRDQYRAYYRQYHLEHRVEHLERQRRYRKANPAKAHARFAVSNALRDGRLIRKPCEVCGAKGQAHHFDYARPLDVRWLCFRHHREEHGQFQP